MSRQDVRAIALRLGESVVKGRHTPPIKLGGGWYAHLYCSDWPCGSGLILDTTVKSGAGLGKVLAPTWNIVWGVKKGQLSPAEYEVIYLNLLRERFKQSKEAFLDILALEECTLTCYCRSGTFCHRHLAVNVLEKIALQYGIPFERGGEVNK